MSYIRRGEQSSDVYVYEDAAGYYTCRNCPRDADPQTPIAAVMVEHLIWHAAFGDEIPNGVVTKIMADGDIPPEVTP